MDLYKESEKFNVLGAGGLLLTMEKDKLKSPNPWLKDRLNKEPIVADLKTKKNKTKTLNSCSCRSEIGKNMIKRFFGC